MWQIVTCDAQGFEVSFQQVSFASLGEIDSDVFPVVNERELFFEWENKSVKARQPPRVDMAVEVSGEKGRYLLETFVRRARLLSERGHHPFHDFTSEAARPFFQGPWS